MARRWNQDPKPNPSISNYAVFANNPIFYSDVLGDTTVISLVNEEKDPIIYKAAQNLVKEQVNDGVFIIVAHMSPRVVQCDYSKDKSVHIYADDLIPFLKKHNQDFNQAYENKSIKVLRLSGCNSASDPYTYFDDAEFLKDTKPIAQQISEANWEWEVQGSTGYVNYSVNKKGRGFIKSISSIYAHDRKHKNDGYNDKGWKVFKTGIDVTHNEKGKNIKSRQVGSKMIHSAKTNKKNAKP